MSIVTPPVSNVAPGGGEGFSFGVEGKCSDDPLSASLDKLQKLFQIKTDPQSTGSTASVDSEASDHELMEIDSQEEGLSSTDANTCVSTLSSTSTASSVMSNAMSSPIATESPLSVTNTTSCTQSLTPTITTLSLSTPTDTFPVTPPIVVSTQQQQSSTSTVSHGPSIIASISTLHVTDASLKSHPDSVSDGTKAKCLNVPKLSVLASRVVSLINKTVPSTPTHHQPSPNTGGTPIGILKHVSQFDTPLSGLKVYYSMCVFIDSFLCLESSCPVC